VAVFNSVFSPRRFARLLRSIFKRGCEDAGIKIVWRPPAVPRFGGHIERLIGTQMGSLHLLPGTTFSNPQERNILTNLEWSARALNWTPDLGVAWQLKTIICYQQFHRLRRAVNLIIVT